MKNKSPANFVPLALAVVVAFLFLFAGLTARAEMKVGSFKNLQSAEKAMVGKKDKVFYPSKDGQSLADAMRQSPGMSLTEARAFDKNHEDQSYLVMWEESGTSGGSGKKTVSEEKVRYVEKPAPAPVPVPEPEVVQDRRPPERRGFLGGIGQFLGSIVSISIQPTLSVEYGGNSGQYYVPEYVPVRRYYYQEQQSYRTYCPPRYPSYRSNRSNRNYCPPSNGGRNTNVINNEVRVQVQRQGSSTRSSSSSGPTFARGDTTRDPSGPTRSGSSSHHR